MARTIYPFLTLLLLLSWSCTDVQEFKKEKPEEKPEDNTENKWIESILRKEYLWYEDIPEKENLDYNLNAGDFFNSLLSKKDGKTKNGSHDFYSAIKEKSKPATKSYLGDVPSLGFAYQTYYITNLRRYGVHVHYILPNSPASGTEIKRGDWIYEINNQSVTPELVENFHLGKEVKLGISSTITPQITKTVTLSSTIVEDDPVYLHKTLNVDGKKIAYLVYNHFTAGTKQGDETFNNSMRKAFTEFKSINPDEFILDLRYNGGGLVTCAQLLSTMLAPATALDDIFCKLTYNDKKSKEETIFRLSTKFMEQGAGGKNLNMKRLFVITSKFSASASEAVINCLRPYMDEVIIVGEKTEGKNVGSEPFTDDRYNWVLHPITCWVSNSKNFSDYADGLMPDVNCSEPDGELLDFGDPNEFILSRVLSLIGGGTPEPQMLRSTELDNINLIPIESPLGRRKTNAVIIDALP